MAYPTKLQQVGTEAFDLFDGIEEHNQRRSIHQTQYYRYQPQSNLTCVYCPRERVIDSFQAAQKYKGMMICEHQAKEPSSYVYPPCARDETVDSFEATHRYNGVMICEHQEKKPPMTTRKKSQNYRNRWSFM